MVRSVYSYTKLFLHLHWSETQYNKSQLFNLTINKHTAQILNFEQI